MTPEPMPNAPRTPQAPHDDDPRRWLSALADGEPDAAAPACRLWCDDGEARKTWHAYHLIGDVLRSEELARPPARDAEFLAGIRSRLAIEPLVLAPAPSVSARRHSRWLLPSAVAAGFVVVAGVLVVTRMGAPWLPGDGPALAAASAAGGLTLVGGAVRSPGAAGLPGDDRLIRDARLDEYLRAHQSARGGVAMAAPGGALRRVEVVVPAGPAR